MQAFKAAVLVAATAVFALTATAPAYAGGQQVDGQEATSSIRWATIAAEGQRFQDQHQVAGPQRVAKSKAFLAMALAARQTR
jgi:hypothetical protein